MAAHGVDLVDEDDTGRILFGLFKHVPHARCTNTDEHFNKVRTGDGEERNARFARDRTRQQSFTGTRRAHKQRTLRDLAAETAEFLRIAQEFNDFFQLFLGFVDACNVVKGHATLLFRQHLGLGFAKAHRAAFAATLHAVHEIDPHTDQQKEGKQAQDKGLEAGLLLRLGFDRDVLVEQKLRHLGVRRGNRHVVFAIRAAIQHLLAVQRHAGHSAVVHGGDEFRIADLAALKGTAVAAE